MSETTEGLLDVNEVLSLGNVVKAIHAIQRTEHRGATLSEVALGLGAPSEDLTVRRLILGALYALVEKEMVKVEDDRIAGRAVTCHFYRLTPPIFSKMQDLYESEELDGTN